MKYNTHTKTFIWDINHPLISAVPDWTQQQQQQRLKPKRPVHMEVKSKEKRPFELGQHPLLPRRDSARGGK